MASIRFLERLRAVESGAPRDTFEDAQEVLRSIIAYVNKLLNTRQGSSVLDDNFGILDFTAFGVAHSRDDIPRFEREISQFVERCEPRLKNIHVHCEPDPSDPFSVNFIIDAALSLDGNATMPVTLTTRVASSGKVIVT